MRYLRALVLLTAGALWPVVSAAHSFGQVFNLPVPFWLYGWGAAATLVLSFLMLGFFVTSKPNEDGQDISGQGREITGQRSRRWASGLIVCLRVLAVAALLLCIATGLWGVNSPYGNFNMTFFWIIFLLGFGYLTALTGNLYDQINPWRTLLSVIRRWLPRQGGGLLTYPRWLAYWPALGFYMAFIWIELFLRNTPHSLAVMLLIYSFINFAGAGLFGLRDWFRYCEFLGLFFRLIAKMAPLHYRRDDPDGRLRIYWRPPFLGLIEAPATSLSLLLFVLFMLSSTAFDGWRETVTWYRLFWADLYKWKLSEWAGTNPLAAFPQMREWYMYWQAAWLLASPWLYLAAYWLCMLCTRCLPGVTLSTRQMALQFAYTLLPIALVYNVTHYYTLIQTQGVKIVSLASDPFGWGWNLFGTRYWLQRSIIPDAMTVWHVQVVLIVLGHVVSVYLAHRLALRLFPGHRLAVLSQVPMLILMVAFTTVGLWILSQPIQAGA